MFNFNQEKIRQDFPILDKRINGKPIIYLDSACMALKPKQVIEKINEYYNEYQGCHGRSNHAFAKKTTEEFEKTRSFSKKFFNTRKEEEIVFTKNTTEGINLIANSLNFKKGDIVLTTNKEHNSNLVPWQVLSKRKSIKHEIVDFDENIISNFENKIKNVKLVSMVYTSNLDGTSIPAKEIIKIAHENGALVLLDAAQTAPHQEIDVKKLDVDFLACSGHKMLGPTGTGILYGKYGLLDKLDPFLVGGDTVVETTYETAEFQKPPHKFEAGLQNYAGIIGLGEALRYLKKQLPLLEKHELELNSFITEKIKSINGLKIIGPQDPALRSGIVSFYIEKIDSNNLAIILDKAYNIMVRPGAHCVHSWFNAHNLKGSLRASLHLYNSMEDCEFFVDSLFKVLKGLS